MSDSSVVDPGVLSKVKSFSSYVEAKLGFRNHWYPVRFSSEIEEGKLVASKVLGLDILLNRIEGRLFAIRDRCIHRGVRFSAKPECYTKGTITCWYHGFTYRFDSGELVNILSVPQSQLIGKARVETYPVEEFKGVVFIFIGDKDKPIPPLSQDLPPQFMQEEIAICGKHRVVESNWRSGVENGWDTIHLYLHRNSDLVREEGLNLPLAMPARDYSKHDFFTVFEDEAGPKGIRTRKGEFVAPVYEGVVEGQVVVRGSQHGREKIPDFSAVWLPGVVVIDPWPARSLLQMEWYVPVDERSHIYFQTIGKTVRTQEERDAFVHEFNSKWCALALDGFNGEDIFARTELERAYSKDTAWVDEQLCEPDVMVMRWRQIAHKHNRGVQRLEHLR
jgi:carbazole 1,9a-dioxygenase